jgi:hypothetical protein
MRLRAMLADVACVQTWLVLFASTAVIGEVGEVGGSGVRRCGG